MISFYPGPSRTYSLIPDYVQDAAKTGVMSMNHRSSECMALVKKTIQELRKKLSIPASYTVLFTSSATECWEIIAQSLINDQSIHLYNGAFGSKWFNYTKAIKPNALSDSFAVNHALNPNQLSYDQGDTICITQNETSNGTQVSNAIIRGIKKNNPNHLIAVDATSSLGGIELNFASADVWFASVQKCLGLPAGLAVLICSSRAITRAEQVGNTTHYNSLINQVRMIKKFQTTHTPNVLGIYLLYRVMKSVSAISVIHKRISKQANEYISMINRIPYLEMYANNTDVLSDTVMTVKASEEAIKKIKWRAKKAGLLLGEGYGALKLTTFRIANFPAIHQKEIKALRSFMEELT
ncbi:MAG: aminotransferase class V-fold PLP-dependent enzyme [Cyclobacteriaceae bacterium]|nr:aminotransferase class V-fold PLP-dependent enzyme [Cyclobacteriaceae bacterium]